MSDSNLAITPAALRSFNRWHLILAAILALLLFLLPRFGIGPNSWRACVTPAVPVVAPAPAPAPLAAAPVAAALAKAVVYFDTAKFDVKEQGLADVKALVAKAGASAKYAISGYHDARGDPVANAELAKNRAFAVRDVMKAAGVPEDRIEMRKPQVTSGGDKLADDPEARRVEVTVEP
jgi:outer membrane protein OmpA-like peptidoglycan-associated protein